MPESVVNELGTFFAVRTRSASRQIVIPCFLLALYAAQCGWFVRTQSLTYDEPMHITEGLDAWRNGRFQDFVDNPPLGRLLCTLLLRDPKWQVDLELLPAGFRLHRALPDPVKLATRARTLNVVLGVLLGVVLWRAAATMFSISAANFALALFAFCPSLIAHFSLATTDGIATVMIFLTAVQVLRWRQRPTWQNGLLCGIVLGALLLSKFSAVPMFVLAMFCMLALAPEGLAFDVRKWKWAKAAVALLVAFLIVWAGYFFHISRVTIRDGVFTASHPHWTAPLVKPTRSKLNISVPIPAGEFIAGLREVALHNARGYPAFFLGGVSKRGGWKAYYPVTILMKWPVIMLALAVVGFALCGLRRKADPQAFWILVSFPAAYFLIAMFSHFNIGERHILPLYPFGLLFAAAVWQRFSRMRFGRGLLILLLALNAADALRYAPDYLSYFGIFVPPPSSYRLLADSNLDWGQGLLALRKYEAEHPNENISLAYFGSVDPAAYGVYGRALGENERARGTVVVSATNLAGEYLKDPNAYRWLLGYRRIAILDHSLFVFQVDH